MSDKAKLDFVYARDRRRCRYCEAPLSRKQATLDHYVPKALGGSNDSENLRLACAACNGRKGDMSPAEWIEVMASPWFKKHQPPRAHPSRQELVARCAPRYRPRPDSLMETG